MILKYLVLFFIFFEVGKTATKRHAKSFGLYQSQTLKLPSVDAVANNQHKEQRRQRRCLSSALVLLMPQVVGPVDKGEIEEKSFDEVPKTLIEYRLDTLRKKARQEEETRLLIREYVKAMIEAGDKFYGPPTYGQSYLETNLV